MAALVEPLGLERGKRARRPCPPGRGLRPGPRAPDSGPRPSPGGAQAGGRARRGWAGRVAASQAVDGRGRVGGPAGRRGGARRPPPAVCAWGSWGRRVTGGSLSTAAGSSAGVRLGLGCLAPGLRSPFLGLRPHISGLRCVFQSLTLCLCAPPPPRRRVPGGGAPRAAPAQRGAAPAEAAGPPASPAEPLLLCHPGGESNAAPGPERAGGRRPPSGSPRAWGLRLPAATGAAFLWGARASAQVSIGNCGSRGLRAAGAGRICGWEGLQARTSGLKAGGGWRLLDAFASSPGL